MRKPVLNLKRNGAERICRRGAMLYFFAAALVVLFGIIVLAVDIAFIRLERAQAQVAADAGALAAAQQFSSEEVTLQLAEHYAEVNHTSAGSDLEVTAELGTWNQVSRSFSTAENASAANAVRVTVQRLELRLLFARLIGFSEVDVAAQAIAFKKPGTFDVVAGTQAILGQGAIQDNYTIYSRDGITYGQDPVLINGSRAGALDSSTIEGDGLEGLTFEADAQPTLALNIMPFIDDLIAGINLPPQITQVEYFPSESHLPATLTPGTAYVFEESISIDQDFSATNVIIATRKNISWGQGGQIQNTALSTGDGFAIGIYAGENIALGQDSVADGVNIVAGKDVTIGQDLASFSGTIQSGEKVIIGQDVVLKGIDLPDAIPGEGGGRSKLVK